MSRAIREFKTRTTKDMWYLAWHVQRSLSKESPEYPFELLKINNLMEYKGRKNEFFLMLRMSGKCQHKISMLKYNYDLATRLLLKKISEGTS
jgi:hypothetical protein